MGVLSGADENGLINRVIKVTNYMFDNLNKFSCEFSFIFLLYVWMLQNRTDETTSLSDLWQNCLIKIFYTIFPAIFIVPQWTVYSISVSYQATTHRNNL